MAENGKAAKSGAGISGRLDWQVNTSLGRGTHAIFYLWVDGFCSVVWVDRDKDDTVGRVDPLKDLESVEWLE